MEYIINNFFTIYIIVLIMFLLANNSYKDRRGIILYIVSTLIYNIGFTFMREADTYEALLLSLKMEILSSNYLMFMMFMAYLKIFGFKINKYVFYSICLIQTLIFLCVISLEKNTLYYYNLHVIEKNGIYLIGRSRGILFYVSTFFTLMLSAACIETIVRFYKRRKRFGCPSCTLMIISILITIFVYVLFLAGVINDYHPIGFVIADTLYVYIGIKYRVYDMDGFTKDYVFNTIKSGIIVIDYNDSVLTANKTAKDLFPKIKDTRIINLYECVPELQGLIEIGKNSNIDVDGKTYEISSEVIELRRDFFGTIVYILDTTTKNELISSLIISKKEADTANIFKTQFLANISHEIRTPVNAIVGMNEMILNECSEQNIKNYATTAKKAGDILSGLINQILDLTKLDANKMELHYVEHDVMYSIHEVESLFVYLAKDKGLEYEINIDRRLPSKVIGDPTRIKQICINLFTNSIKYTQKGKVTLSFLLDKIEGNIATMVIVVEDTGIGIKEEDRKKVFEAFNRLEEDRNKNIDGIGLGLYITRELVDLMKGTINLKSKYGSGSVFEVFLPLRIVEMNEIGEYASTKELLCEDINIPWCRILAVDDNDMNLKIIYNFLKDTNAKITLVKSGYSCIEELKENEYDLILMDDRMPDMDGVRTLSEIRNMFDNQNNNIPVIMVTANAVSGYEDKYINAGFIDYLAKPITKEKLVNCVRSHLICNGINSDDRLKHYKSSDIYFQKLKSMIDAEAIISSRIMQLFEKREYDNLINYLQNIKNIFIDAGADTVTFRINKIIVNYRNSNELNGDHVKKLALEIKRVALAGNYYLEYYF